MKNIKPFPDSTKSQKQNYSTPQKEYYQDAQPSYQRACNTSVKKIPPTTEWSHTGPYHSGAFLQPPQINLQLEEETLEKNIPKNMSRDDVDSADRHYFKNSEDNDAPSPTSKKEEKYLKRKLKNEKNYKDLNQSLANLAMKRVNRSSSSDPNSLLYSSQPQSQIDRSYNFEFQPNLYTPTTGGKAFSSQNNPFNSGLNISYTSHPYISQQNSPIRTDLCGSYSRNGSPETKRPQYKHNIYHSEQVFQTPQNKHLRIPFQPPSPITSTDRLRAVETKEDQSTKRKDYQRPWSNTNAKLFPGQTEKSIFSHQVERRGPGSRNQHERIDSRSPSRNRVPSTCSIERANIAPDTSLSFPSLIGNQRKQVLDSRLPSKADLSEDQSFRGLDDTYNNWRDKTITLNSNINPDKFREESISRGPNQRNGGRPSKSPSKSNNKRSSIENQSMEAWKQEILQIKHDMEKRKQHYKEFEDFIKFYDPEDRNEKFGYESNTVSTWDKNSNEDQRFNSIFSISNGTRYEGFDSKSSNNFLVSPTSPPSEGILKKTSAKNSRVSFKLKKPEPLGESSQHVRSRNSPVNQQQFRGRKNQSPYFRPEMNSYDAGLPSRTARLESNNQQISKCSDEASCQIF